LDRYEKGPLDEKHLAKGANVKEGKIGEGIGKRQGNNWLVF